MPQQRWSHLRAARAASNPPQQPILRPRLGEKQPFSASASASASSSASSSSSAAAPASSATSVSTSSRACSAPPPWAASVSAGRASAMPNPDRPNDAPGNQAAAAPAASAPPNANQHLAYYQQFVRDITSSGLTGSETAPEREAVVANAFQQLPPSARDPTAVPALFVAKVPVIKAVGQDMRSRLRDNEDSNIARKQRYRAFIDEAWGSATAYLPPGCRPATDDAQRSSHAAAPVSVAIDGLAALNDLRALTLDARREGIQDLQELWDAESGRGVLAKALAETHDPPRYTKTVIHNALQMFRQQCQRALPNAAIPTGPAAPILPAAAPAAQASAAALDMGNVVVQRRRSRSRQSSDRGGSDRDGSHHGRAYSDFSGDDDGDYYGFGSADSGDDESPSSAVKRSPSPELGRRHPVPVLAEAADSSVLLDGNKGAGGADSNNDSNRPLAQKHKNDEHAQSHEHDRHKRQRVDDGDLEADLSLDLEMLPEDGDEGKNKSPLPASHSETKNQDDNNDVVVLDAAPFPCLGQAPAAKRPDKTLAKMMLGQTRSDADVGAPPALGSDLVQRLKPGQWYNDSLVLKLVRMVACARPPWSWLVVDPLLLASVERSDTQMEWMAKLLDHQGSLPETTGVLLLVNDNNYHWVLGVIDRSSNATATAADRDRVILYDSAAPSLGCKRPESLSLPQRMKAWLDKQSGRPWTVLYGSCPQQDNSYDCGPMVVAMAAHIVAAMPIPAKLDSHMLRRAWQLMLCGDDGDGRGEDDDQGAATLVAVPTPSPFLSSRGDAATDKGKTAPLYDVLAYMESIRRSTSESLHGQISALEAKKQSRAALPCVAVEALLEKLCALASMRVKAADLQLHRAQTIAALDSVAGLGRPNPAARAALMAGLADIERDMAKLEEGVQPPDLFPGLRTDLVAKAALAPRELLAVLDNAVTTLSAEKILIEKQIQGLRNALAKLD